MRLIELLTIHSLDNIGNKINHQQLLSLVVPKCKGLCRKRLFSKQGYNIISQVLSSCIRAAFTMFHMCGGKLWDLESTPPLQKCYKPKM